MSSVLKSINSPNDIKGLNDTDLEILCSELREEIIRVTSQNGGHLASNLGVVELTVALLSVLDIPKDTIIWDVGHQAYSYKMLTGRLNKFNTIRKENGLAGFPDRDESEYDLFTVGHSSTAVSVGFGVSSAKKIQKDDSLTVSIIGDGAFTGGLAFEALNNAGKSKTNFIVILNDNNMSISKNVGSLSSHLGLLRRTKKYVKFKGNIGKSVDKIPVIGKSINSVLKRGKTFIRRFFIKTSIFEKMGFTYYGMIDGHDISSLVNVLETSKISKKPVLIHVKTTKGKGYERAEQSPKDYHGVPKFNPDTGEKQTDKRVFSDVVGDVLVNTARVNSDLCVITAAMCAGTGLTEYYENFRERFFDVGIAEAHAVTFGAGLSAKGMTPVFAVYSTFLQRAYDSIVHDVAMQKLKLILAIDRAGFVGEDGKTHQGLLDVSMLKNLPDATVFSPSYFDELDFTMQKAISGDYNNIVAVRYPKGHEGYKPKGFVYNNEDYMQFGFKEANTCIVCYGRVFPEAAMILDEMKINIIKLNKIVPIEDKAVEIALKHKKVLFVEEAVGGIADVFGKKLTKAGFKGKYIITDVKTPFIVHASVQRQMEMTGLDKQGILRTLKGGLS